MNGFKNDLFARRVREKRGERSLRDIATELDIGLATLSRIENGKMPDMHNFAVISAWLGDNPAIFFHLGEGKNDDPITGQLRAAQSMSVETAKAFMDVIRTTYAELLEQANEEDRA